MTTTNAIFTDLSFFMIVPGLNEVFPPIVKFSTVSHCLQTRRIAAGGKNGSLAVYDIRQPAKCHVMTAHNGPITGKHAPSNVK